MLSDGTLLMKEIRENLEKLSCQVVASSTDVNQITMNTNSLLLTNLFQVENIHGKDSISYTISAVRAPVAPTIR